MSRLLLLGRQSVRSLVPTTFLSQVESLLESHRLEHAADLADQEARRQLYGGVPVDQAEKEQLQYIYQRIGFQYFKETIFENAGKHLFDGELDPRVLVSFFPDLRGDLYGENDTVNMYSGVAEHMPTESSVEELIAANLVRNYSPHLSPNTREAPSTSELRKILFTAAEDMLEAFLRKWRTRRVLENQNKSGGGGGAGSSRSEEYAVVDTILVKLFAKSEKTQDLYVLLSEAHNVIISEVEPVLIKNGQYNALCLLYKQAGDLLYKQAEVDEKLLDIWAKLIDGIWVDEDIPNPTADLVAHLTQLNERPDKSPAQMQLTQKWALWLMHESRDPEQGLKLLVSSRGPTRATGKRRQTHQNNKSIEDMEMDQDLLSRIKEANPVAAVQYLEYMILQRGNKAREIHMEYASTCIDEVLGYLKNEEAVERLWRAKAASYSSSSSSATSSQSSIPSAPPPFASYFASTTPDSPSKRARLKSLLFLQTSALYDASVIKERILDFHVDGKAAKAGQKPILSLELAILESKLGNHRTVLECLVDDVRDGASAEAYCTGRNGGGNGGREVIPARLRRSIAENTDGLSAWKDNAITAGRPGKGDDDAGPTNAELLKILLEVYMKIGGGEATKEAGIVEQQQVARLLNSQGIHLDVEDVIQTLPPSWPLHLVSSFISRSFRRTLHTSHETQILKMLALSENWDIKERTWPILRDEGCVIEEGVEGGGEGEDKDVGEGVDVVLDEKTVLPSEDPPPVDVFTEPKEE
ncbi:hypothetical protein GYMLUDRAFT_163867 [Collybiopsis luxurians FD-317 M1]|uniref:Vacuolar sorting protein 39/Transforming growth factor beta receptor-associated domain-containing protein n=1 Tax=Collybiopsis luxurians FD-317 M1 TaxID=944289 RepID=A0A0D0CU47_9AGAR|nr:hypothetical protein GYMLUDRAFT_163867 [Collybiopsis luxurians FD-317 M1]